MVILPPFSLNNVKSYIDYNKQVQIAGFDLTVRNISLPEDGGELDFDNCKRKIPEYTSIPLQDDKWVLQPGGYIVQYNEIVEVPLNAVGILFPRSSLMRIGATIYSALWDPGYKGRGVGLLQTTKQITIHRNARIAQIIFLETQSKATKGYNGKYQNEGV
ncbi:MAG: deoxyuridine 5'-triphosphate nucleotidohydrolase [Candidatus Heimdallarchaeaceae archaeon]